MNELNRVFLNGSYDFTEKLSGRFTGYVSSTLNSAQNNNIEQRFYYISPQLNYKLTEKLALTPGYSYGLRENKGIKRTTDQHVVWLSLNYSYPLHAQ